MPIALKAALILRDATTEDTDVDLLEAADDPVLDTGDVHYGNISQMKECDALNINAYWPSATISPSGTIKVEAAARNMLSQPVDYKNKGNWTQVLEDEWITFQEPACGKVLRYRFTGQNMRGLRFDAYEDSVRAKGAER